MILPSSRTASAGYSAGSTMDIAGVASTKGKVASGLFSLKVTSRSPLTSTVFRLPRSPLGPPLTSILLMRSMEYLTAAASSLSPFENAMPSRSLQW